MSVTTIPLRNLPKHDRYENAYRRFGFFWGLGIEHETYLMTSQSKVIKSLEGIMKPERYSVNYYAAYKQGIVTPALRDVVTANGGSLTVPILMNGHSLTHCDINGEHKTTYERVPKPNPNYSGLTLFDWMCNYSTWLRNEIDRIFMWDGDTIEFMTQDFYRARVANVLAELEESEARFVHELSRLPNEGILETYGPLTLASPMNQPWATFVTNPKNVSMFNNGTIHINVTLPTRLGWNKKPWQPADFLEKHRALARLVQWFEPLWIAAHGSGDPFASRSPAYGSQFAAGSQRLAVSRYIGLGTFDTNAMPVGKINQMQKSELGPLPWYEGLYQRTSYEPLDVIGLDLNYNKHWAHGLELRFLDQLPMISLRSVVTQVVVLMDLAMEGWMPPDPRKDPVWIKMAEEALYAGGGWMVPAEALQAVCRACRINAEQKGSLTPAESLSWLFDQMEERKAFCWSKMMKPRRKPRRCC
jgi:hypothetical protein